MTWICKQVLKCDQFGQIELGQWKNQLCIKRNITLSWWWTKPLAIVLAKNESRALEQLTHLPFVPKLLQPWKAGCLIRTWLEAEPMHIAKPDQADYYKQAARYLHQIHRALISHNDLAKQPNWLVSTHGAPLLIDFQLALHHRSRSKLFRILAYDDIRHLIKHKSCYCPQYLTQRERRILSKSSFIATAWRLGVKPIYWFITRKLLHWADQEGYGERQLNIKQKPND